MAVAEEGNAGDRGGSSADDRWEREIDAVEASSVCRQRCSLWLKGKREMVAATEATGRNIVSTGGARDGLGCGGCETRRQQWRLQRRRRRWLKATAAVAKDKATRLLRSLGKETQEVAVVDDRGLRLGTEEEEGTWLASDKEEKGSNNGDYEIGWQRQVGTEMAMVQGSKILSELKALTTSDKAGTKDDSAGFASRGRMAARKRGRRAVVATIVVANGEEETRAALMARLEEGTMMRAAVGEVPRPASVNVGAALEGDAGSVISCGGLVAAGGWSSRMGHDWATESNGDRYGLRRKMKKLRKVAAVGSWRRKRQQERGEGRVQRRHGATTETLGSTSKGRQQKLRAEGEARQQQRRLWLRGLQAADEGSSSSDRGDDDGNAAAM
ncbi:hypothetical protein BHE74_00019998 [Ensete ventricosum]|nr:hypothetical protein BHE74_00019998 [Ensete ventricosum]